MLSTETVQNSSNSSESADTLRAIVSIASFNLSKNWTSVEAKAG